ncbi:hypothetical protein Q9L58_006894 [Maublancomyces gigas]|uniref:Uncharacterized protein n=1 Tax=Discina gigas TaxID=1032678 RepID=A0ABR3GE93_9PEZI
MPQSLGPIGPVYESSDVVSSLNVNDSDTSSDDSIGLDPFPSEISWFGILADESVEGTAEYTDAEYMRKIATVSDGSHQHIVKLGIRCIMDRLQKRKGQGIRKKLLKDAKKRRDGDRERRARILKRMEDQQEKRFLNMSAGVVSRELLM